MTYKGNTEFRTVCGGLISIMLFFGFLAYLGGELFEAYYYPLFITTPPTYDFRDSAAFLQPEYGNTVAMLIKEKDSGADYMRV